MTKLRIIFFSFLLITLNLTNTWAKSSTTETIVIFRHAEKPQGGLGQLSCQGLNRALALPKALNAKFGKPDYIFAPDPTVQAHDSGKAYYYVRPIATIEPTAIYHEMPINIQYGFGEIDSKSGLASELLSSTYHSSLVFVTWEHSYAVRLAKEIANATGYEGNIPSWSNDNYDKLYVFTITWNGSEPNVKFEEQSEGLNNLSKGCPMM